jgi:NAD(P)-dependent dehydrogenase (short-subunit alcohol dehydrogenase family)
MEELNDKVAVITGAGGGFGREFARRAAREGMRLVLADVQRDALDAVVDELRESGVAVIGEVVDVAVSRQVAHLADRAYAEFGGVHLLMNNAGVACGGYVWESTEKDWQWVLGVNLMGVVHGVQHFLPRMLEANGRGESGHVVNTASMAGWLTAPLMGVYNVSKHAVVALTETLFHDLKLAQSSIGVTVLNPAFVPTGIAHSHRVRPPELANSGTPTRSQQMAQAGSEKAVSSGRISATDVAAMTFDAIRASRFYVFTHPQIMPSVEARFAAVLDGDAPADPYATRPTTRPTTPA